MAATFNFELVSPERILLATEDAEQVQLPGSEGDFTVLAGHTPVIAALRPGILEINIGGSRRRMYVRGGFAEVQPDSLTVLAQMAMEVAEMDADRIAGELELAEADLASARDDEARRMASFAIAQLKTMQGGAKG
jgi:F-type H+-transporting ATPase subunit epsilon